MLFVVLSASKRKLSASFVSALHVVPVAPPNEQVKAVVLSAVPFVKLSAKPDASRSALHANRNELFERTDERFAEL